MLEPGQSRVVKQLADGAPTADLLATLCQAIEERGAGALASILILDQDGRRLRLGAAPSLPGDFNRALDGVEIGTGAWRAAVGDGTRVIVDDIATDPSWKDCRGLVAGHGFRSCWLQPIRSSSGAALGTLALYFRQRRKPDGGDFGPIEEASHLAGIAIERERMADALRRSEERFRDIAEATSDWIWEMDADLRITYVSDHYYEIVDTTPEKIIGRKRSEIPPELPCEAWEKYLETLEAHRPYKGFVFSRVLRDGSMAWFSSSDKPVFDADGRFAGYRCATSDITARVVAERELLESEERYRTLVDLSPDAIGVSDGARLVFANRAYAAMHGADGPDELIDGDFLDLIHPDEREEVGRRTSTTIEEWRTEATVVRRKRLRIDGTEFVTETATAPIMWRGRRQFLSVARDVTERERADGALRESEDRYRSLVELSPDGIMVHDTERIVFANAAAARLHGAASAEEMIGLEWRDLIHPEELDDALRRRNEMLSSWKPLPFVDRRRLKLDGTEIRVSTGAAPIVWRGQPAAMGVFRDVTERLEAEGRLRRSEEKFATAFHVSPDSIVILRVPERTVVDANEKFMADVGLTRDDIVGHPIQEFSEWLDPDAPAKFHARLNADGEVVNFPADTRMRDGEILHMRYSARAIEIDGERCVLVNCLDVTDQTRIENALRESEDRYRSLVELSPDGVMVHSDGVVTFANASLARILGTDAPDRIVGMSALDFVPAADRAAVMARREQALRETSFDFRETSYLRLDGSTVAVERGGARITWRGKPSFLVIVRDITERREAERKAQEQAENLAQIQRLNTIGQLSSALAHEINQPLFAAMGFVEVGGQVLRSGDGDGVAKAADLMDKAADQLDRAAGIIRRLRSFVEKRRSARVEEDLNEVVEDACSIALIGAREMDVQVTLDLDDGLPAVVIDRIQIEQVLLNLVRNALDAMRDRSERELKIRTSRRDGAVLVAVADTGAGLADEVSARLFEPFVTTKEGGMGVGLSISRSIVEAHGGTVWATNNSAGGTTFSFTLKATRHAETEGVE